MSKPAAASPEAKPAKSESTASPASSKPSKASPSGGSPRHDSRKSPSSPPSGSIGPVVSKEVQDHAKLPAMKRVKLAYKIVRKRQLFGPPSAGMRSGSGRDPFGDELRRQERKKADAAAAAQLAKKQQAKPTAQLTAMQRVKKAFAARDRKAASAVMRSRTKRATTELLQEDPRPERKKRVEEEHAKRTEELSRKLHYDPTSISPDGGSPKHPYRGTAWSKDGVERGTYAFPWTTLPRHTPTRSDVPPTPGPGTYTSPLHFIGH